MVTTIISAASDALRRSRPSPWNERGQHQKGGIALYPAQRLTISLQHQNVTGPQAGL
jgi:hypothetical protein